MEKQYSGQRTSSRQYSPKGDDSYYLPRKTYVAPADVFDHRGRILMSSPKVHEGDHQRIATRKAAAEDMRSKLRTKTTVKKHEHNRHVTFQPDLAKRDQLSIHPAHRRQERPVSGRAGDVTPVDHRIASHGGTTSTLECLPHRLRISKTQPPASPKARIEELTREVGHLRQELAYYKDTRQVLMKLYGSIKASQETLQATLTEASRGLAISEQRFVEYWVPQQDDENVEEIIF